MVTLVILDGFGYRKEKQGNAIKTAGTPHLDKLFNNYPFTLLNASGESVGLPAGQMGNSEVGHLTLGSGRVNWQDLMKINKDINNGNFKNNCNLQKAFLHAQNNKSNLHLMGLLSNGGVHSHIDHLFAILSCAKDYKIPNIYIHVFTDGRDTKIDSGIDFVKKLQSQIQNTNAKIATISGRIFAMDREQRYDRLQKAYDALVYGKGEFCNSAEDCLLQSYKNGIFDEFVVPTIIDKNGIINDNDSVIFYNFRADRAREITFALTDKNFKHFKTKKFNNLLFSPMEEYATEFSKLNTLYPPKTIEDNLSAILSSNGLKQFHIAETTKYAHVTFFFNGTIEKPYINEDRKLIESINTQDYSQYPKMRAEEITEQTIKAIQSGKYDFILVNYSNPDMIGHTGDFDATVKAIKCIDEQASTLAHEVLKMGGDCIITADHGNAEFMFDSNGTKVTSHTTNKVPCVLVSNKYKDKKLAENNSISNIAPTILKMLNINIPNTMDKPLF